jgi:hypothetical protein
MLSYCDTCEHTDSSDCLDKNNYLECDVYKNRRGCQMPPPSQVFEDSINPPHYQAFCETLQWLETMNRIPRYKNPEAFKGALELQIRKYLDRNGRKDGELKELLKGFWYYKYMIAYIANGEKPILVKNVDKLIKSVM